MLLALADFLDTLLCRIVLVGVSLSLGSVAWGLWVLRAPGAGTPVVVGRRCRSLCLRLQRALAC